jgi:DNA uptake protein ComE-like DNA-binding protein
MRDKLQAQRLIDMKEKLKRLQGQAELAGLNINVKKTKEMRVNVTTKKN